MNKNEARLLFSGSSKEEIDNEFEDRFFQLKQLLIQKAPIRKLWDSKLDHFERIIAGYRALNESFDREDGLPEIARPNFFNDVEQAYNEYQRIRSAILQRATVTSSPERFVSMVKLYFDVSDAYMELWNVVDDSEAVIVSKEPDPMDVISAIKDFKSRGYKHFEDIKDLPDDHLLVLESKRLTLLLKKNQNA